jgi:hypothetical protein
MTFGMLLMTGLEIDTPYWQVAINAILIGMGLELFQCRQLSLHFGTR